MCGALCVLECAFVCVCVLLLVVFVCVCFSVHRCAAFDSLYVLCLVCLVMIVSGWLLCFAVLSGVVFVFDCFACVC